MQGYFNLWPEVVHDFADLIGRMPEPMRLPPPLPAAISRMEETFGWVKFLEPEDARLVWARAEGAPWNLGDGFEAFLYDACLNILTVTKGGVYMCMSSSELHTLQTAFKAAGGHWSTFVIWAKNTFTLGRSDYQRQYEPILYGWKEGTDHFWCGARDQGDVWFVDKPRKNDLHPTMKPVALVERAIRNSSKSRDIVLDPFGGSGTTLIACEKTGRSARLIELDPKYVDVVVSRWEQHTGGIAVLEADGSRFGSTIGQREA